MSNTIKVADYLRLIDQEKPKPTPSRKKDRPAPPLIRLGEGTKGNVTELLFMGLVPGMNGRGGLIRMSHKRKTKLRNHYQLVVMAHKPKKHTGPVRVELIRHSIGREMDYPNLVSTEKLPLDAIVRAGILPDDNNSIIRERSYHQTRALNKDSQFTIIRILDLPNGKEVLSGAV